eukprot:m.102568 g.102568  ORF g.102568 m.102568 type:complete len:113 (+) comp51540_c1_seq2:1133-1471(+)
MSQSDETGPMDLSQAAARADVAQMTALLQAGTDVNSRSPTARYPWSALHEAARGGHVHICALLLDHHAHINALCDLDPAVSAFMSSSSSRHHLIPGFYFFVSVSVCFFVSVW